MSLSAEQDSSSFIHDPGLFWVTVVLVVLTVALVAIGLWAFRRDRRSLILNRGLTPIIDSNPKLGTRLKVTWDDEAIAHPTLVGISIFNNGRRDIGEDAFDGHRPIVISFPGEIVSVLEPDTEHPHALLPVEREGDVLRIGPGLIKRYDFINIVVLTRLEQKPVITMPLRDVQVKEGFVKRSMPPLWTFALIVWIGLTIALVAIAIAQNST